MGVYTPEQLKVKAPSGGFQTGGWYNGRQYWNGTLSEAGVIHPESNQQGAGGAVNPEVVKATNIQQGLKPGTNEAYIQQQNQQAQNVPSSQPNPNYSGSDGGYLSGGGATPTGASIPTLSATPTLNLPELYKGLYASSGIDKIQADLSEKEKQFIEAKGKTNDNPFISEATRVGRIAKLESLYNERTQSLKNDIATKKADIETQLNLQTKQFDINSETAKQALSTFNTLLESGALNGATGEDIANITRSTGLSSTIINSAIQANKAKNVKTSVSTYTSDSGEVTAVVINADTGAVVSKTSLGRIGNAQNGSSTADKKVLEEQQTQSNLVTDVKKGATLKDLINHYGVPGGLSVDDIYRLYNSNSPYGVAKETLDMAKQGTFEV